ncbi:MAG: GMC family oxidoreductase [Deltaproteobacteria bacterium]|nr:GMC family oxidoreductase [Deltaproteobacteria bacterium]
MGDTEIVIIGGGPGGLAAAWRLTSRGVRVALLESGRRFSPAVDYPQTQDDFERHDFPYDPERDAEGRPRYGFGVGQEIGPEWEAYRSFDRVFGRYVNGDRRDFVRYEHVRGVGGSTLHFQGEAHRFHPYALEMRSRFGEGTDWPLSYSELERYYEIIEEHIGVAAPSGNEWRPRSKAPPLPPHGLSYASRRLSAAFEAIGAPLVANSLAILSQPHNGRPPCNYCNSCTQGCPLGDKASADVVFLPPAAGTKRLDLYADVQVVELEVDGAGRVNAVAYAKPDGTRERLSCNAVIVACGAIETPRLLLLSKSKRFPHGLANNSGQVGLHLTEHLHWSAVAMLPERVDAHRGQPIDGTAWRFAVPNESPRGYVGGFRLSTAHGALGLRGPAAYAQRFIAGFGRAHQERMAAQFGHAVGLIAMGEWLPNQETYVDLDPSLRDATGLPVARIHSQLGDNERQLLRHMADTTRAVFGAVPGAEIVEETSALDRFSAAHVLGTCRMGTDRQTAVADGDGISHEVPNLAFAGGAVVPSSGSGDAPSLTIMALAVRTADRLIGRLSAQG